MGHRSVVPAWFEGASELDSSGARCAPSWRGDLMDLNSRYGASPRVQLDLAIRVVGAPGKLDVDGGDVEHRVGAGRIEDVRGDCDTDVLNCVLVWSGHQRLWGLLTAEEQGRVAEAMRASLRPEGEVRPQLGAFPHAWQAG